MKITKLKLTGISLDDFVNFIIFHVNFSYESHSPKMTVLVNQITQPFDEYYCITDILIARDMNTEIHVDLISNPDDYSIIETFKNQELRFSKRVKRVLNSYGKDKGIVFEEITSD